MKQVFSLAIIAAALVSASPANDWSKPCFHGECAYELAGTPESGSGYIRITGSPKSITDITPSAGWVILDCDPHALAQDVRLVCKNEDAGCNHLFEHDGPVNKVVRLPESCGAGPFGRISNAYIAEDQSIPKHISRQLNRRDGVTPQVHVVSIDDKWDSIDTEKMGNTEFALVTTSIPGARLRPNELQSRAAQGWFDDAIKWLKTAAQDAAEQVKGAAELEIKGNKVLAKTKYKDNKVLFDEKIKCANLPEAGLKVDVDIALDASGHVGVVATGKLAPPGLNHFGAFIGFSGSAEVHFNVVGSAKGEKSHSQPLAELAVPGTSIPGVISLGPKVQAVATANIKLDLEASIKTGLKLKLDEVEFWHPPNNQKPVDKVTPQDSPVALGAGAEASGSLSGNVHVIPKVLLGLDGLSGKIKANIYVAIDLFADLSLSSKGHAKAGKHRRYVPPYSRELATRGGSAGFSGDVDIHVGVDIKAGVDGSLFSFISGSKDFPLYNHKWQLYKAHWEGGAQKRMIDEFDYVPPTSLERRATQALNCPSIIDKISTFLSGKNAKPT